MTPTNFGFVHGGAKRERDISAIEFDDIARELNTDLEAAGMRKVVITQPQALAEVLLADARMR